MSSIIQNIVWIDGFDTPKTSQGVSARFKALLASIESINYDKSKDYACANSDLTPSTAISSKRLKKCEECQGRVLYGRYTSKDKSWKVYELDKKVIRDKMNAKNGDKARLNINEQTGKPKQIWPKSED